MANSEIEQHRLLSQEQLTALPLPAGLASVVAVYLSSITLVVHFELDVPSAAGGRPGSEASQDTIEDLKSQLRIAMRTLLMRLGEHGVVCPGVALLSPSAPTAAPVAGANDAFSKAYGVVQGDQRWHRGEFLVFVEVSKREATERLIDLLDPEPPKATLEPSAQRLADIIARCSSAHDNVLLSKLGQAWNDAPSEAKSETDSGAAASDRSEHEAHDKLLADAGLRAIEEHLRPLFERVSALRQAVG